MAADNKILGEFELSGFPPSPRFDANTFVVT